MENSAANIFCSPNTRTQVVNHLISVTLTESDQTLLDAVKASLASVTATRIKLNGTLVSMQKHFQHRFFVNSSSK